MWHGIPASTIEARVPLIGSLSSTKNFRYIFTDANGHIVVLLLLRIGIRGPFSLANIFQPAVHVRRPGRVRSRAMRNIGMTMVGQGGQPAGGMPAVMHVTIERDSSLFQSLASTETGRLLKI